jgi:hypothetical protein
LRLVLQGSSIWLLGNSAQPVMKGSPMATSKAKAKVSVKVAVSATANKVDKARTTNARKGVKQHYSDAKAVAFWQLLALVVKSPLIPMELRVATKNNAQARRQWCIDNKAVVVSRADVTHKVQGDRPDNAVRARLISLAKVDASAKRVGYVRVLDAYTASRNPKHADIDKVYLYRIA